MIFKKFFTELYLRPTFVSIFGSIFTLLISILITYQILFIDLSGGASLGPALEMVAILFAITLILIDRKALDYISNKKLSIIEAILIIGYLTYNYFTTDNSFSIG